MKNLFSKRPKGKSDTGREPGRDLSGELHDLYSLMELNLLVAQGMARNEIGLLVTTAIPFLLKVPFVALGLSEAEGEDWLVVGQWDRHPLDAATAQEMASLLTGGLANSVFSVAGSLLLADLPEASGTVPEPLTKLGLKSALVIPVRTIASKFGVIIVGSEVVGNFTSKQRLLITTVASHMAVALENASLIKQAQESEERYRSTLDSMLEGCQIIGFDWRYLYVNDAAVKHVRRAKEELLGRTLMEVYPGIEDTEMFAALRRCMEKPIPHHREDEFAFPDGTKGWFDLNFHPVPEGIFILSDDITERKRAEEEIRHRLRVEVAVARVSTTFVGVDDFDGKLNTALEILGGVVNANRVYVFQLEGASKMSNTHEWCSSGTEPQIENLQHLGVDLFPWWMEKLQRNENIVVPDVSQLPPEAKPEKELLEAQSIRSLLVVPMYSHDKLVGFVGFDDTQGTRSWLDEDVRLLRVASDIITTALERKRAEEALRQSEERYRSLSITDELTGLYNRRHFYEVIEDEMHRTQRYGRSFCLTMLDLDEFKEYNDRFGHTNGDAVLKTLAQTLKSALRRPDIAFRYGGDEFTIILPATDANRARKILDRLRSKWLQTSEAAHTVEHPLGLSAGIAQFPENAGTADGLMFLADTALYHSKRQGGNKSTLVSDLGTLPPGVLHPATLDQIYALAATVDAKDPFTYGHSMRVAAISEMIGKAIGLAKKELSDLHAACLLHDIGKVGVPDSILAKSGKPTENEWRLIKRHAVEGTRIVGYVKELAALIPVILHHHEWYDGTGYPDGLKREEIPLGARIVSVADAYDTMTTQRHYRKAMSQQQALEELRQRSGTQFDPAIVEALCRALSEAVTQDDRTQYL